MLTPAALETCLIQVFSRDFEMLYHYWVAYLDMLSFSVLALPILPSCFFYGPILLSLCYNTQCVIPEFRRFRMNETRGNSRNWWEVLLVEKSVAKRECLGLLDDFTGGKRLQLTR